MRLSALLRSFLLRGTAEVVRVKRLLEHDRLLYADGPVVLLTFLLGLLLAERWLEVSALPYRGVARVLVNLLPRVVALAVAVGFDKLLSFCPFVEPH